MKRKLLSLVLAMLMLFGILPTQAFAEEGETIAYAVEGGNIYFDKATGTITDADKTVTSANIPAEIDGVAVKIIGSRAFYALTDLASVSIPDSVEFIEYNAFASCVSLQSVTIPGSVIEIFDSAFENCDALVDLTICQGVDSIGTRAFVDCDSLTEVHIPASVRAMGETPFFACDNLSAYMVDEANECFSSDGYGVLFDKEKTILMHCPPKHSGSYVIPEGVTIIASYGFNDCEELINVTLPESLQSIGYDAFNSCDALQTIRIPASVIYISENAFHYATALDGIWVDEANEFYSSDSNGIFFNKDKTKLIQCCRSYAGEYVIPESVQEILSNAFSGCTSLTAVTIPDGVTQIGYWSFYNCTGLTSVAIPQSIKEIGSSAFWFCENLAEISIADAAVSIAGTAFNATAFVNDESNWENGVLYIGNHLIDAENTLEGAYEIREGTVTIADEAFRACEALTDVTIPEGILTIGLDAFIDSGYYNEEKNWTDGVLYNGNYLLKAQTGIEGTYEIRENTTLIADFAFSNCEQLESVTIPDSVKRIGIYAFSGCAGLESMTIPESITEIPSGMFSSCYYLLRVTIPTTVTMIEEAAFAYCGVYEIYYGGLAAQWNEIEIGELNDRLETALIHFKDGTTSEEPSEPSEEPSEPSEEPSEPSEEPSEPSEEPSEPSEDPSEPSEEPSEPDEPEIPTENPFTDVKDSDYFATPVLWAVGNGITNGMSATSFAPNANCTRGQIVTFLWRACGSPEPTKTDNPFTDVKADAYYYKAVLWAVENGITTGLSATTFGPDATCTRGQVATFLWRSQGEPAPKSTNNPFSDVKTNDYYFNAVLWAVENNVTQGMGGGKFAPNDSCTRGQIVTFLYRAIA